MITIQSKLLRKTVSRINSTSVGYYCKHEKELKPFFTENCKGTVVKYNWPFYTSALLFIFSEHYT